MSLRSNPVSEASRNVTPVYILYVRNGSGSTESSIALLIIGLQSAITVNRSVREKPVASFSMPITEAVIGETGNVWKDM